jgi:phosphatidylserine decarboxylase
LNFLLTNRIPRIALTHFMGWFSQLRNPWLAKASIWIWRQFADLDLSEAKQTQFASLHECFIRELRAGARPIDTDIQTLVSPCDGIVGALGDVEDGLVFQAKGFPYRLEELLGESAQHGPWHNGKYLTIRITSSMYHRFHAPHDGRMHRMEYFSGDTWNVNPIALKRVEKLFCKNERALLEMEIGAKRHPVALVPVAAVLVASIRLHAIDTLLHTRYPGPNVISCDAPFHKGDELGWFQHGSTILVFTPPGFSFAPGIEEGRVLRMGQALMGLPATD